MGGYNIEKQIYSVRPGDGSNTAIFSDVYRNSVVYLMGWARRGGDLGKSISALVPGET